MQFDFLQFAHVNNEVIYKKKFSLGLPTYQFVFTKIAIYQFDVMGIQKIHIRKFKNCPGATGGGIRVQYSKDEQPNLTAADCIAVLDWTEKREQNPFHFPPIFHPSFFRSLDI